MKIRYIDDNEGLRTLLDYLSSKDVIAIDLEFDKNRFQYGFTMCLMQIFDGSVCYMIDPLSRDLDVEKVFPLIEDPKVMKVGFELGEDLRLFHSLGCQTRNIYDVSIASKLLDYSQISLVNAIDQVLGIETSKGSQKSNWVKRPLSKQQLDYAAEDVVYLFELKSKLADELEAKGMIDWVEQEREELEQIESAEQDAHSYIKTSDSKGVNEQDWFVFVGLMEFREELAEKYNKPSYQVLDKAYLLDLAQDASEIDRFDQKARALRSLRNGSFRARLGSELSSLRAEARKEGRSPSGSARGPYDKSKVREARERKKREDHIIDTYLKPIQASLKETYGENAAVFIMGNRLMRELASGIEDSLLPYKRTLITDHAARVGINLEPLQISAA